MPFPENFLKLRERRQRRQDLSLRLRLPVLLQFPFSTWLEEVVNAAVLQVGVELVFLLNLLGKKTHRHVAGDVR